MTTHFRTTATLALTALIVCATVLIATWGSAPAAAQDGPTPVPDRAVVPLEVELVSAYELPTGAADVRIAPDGSAYFLTPDGMLTRGGPGGVTLLLGEEPIYYPGAYVHFAMGDGSVRLGPIGMPIVTSYYTILLERGGGPLIVGPTGLLYQTGGTSGDVVSLPAVNALLPYMEQQNVYKMAAASNGDLVVAVETPDGIALARQGWTPQGEPVAQWDGFYTLPEVGDEVLITGLYPAADGSVWIEFEQGDLSMPSVARIGPTGETTTHLLLPAVQALTAYTPETGNNIIGILVASVVDGRVMRAGPEDAAFEVWFTVDDLQTDSLRWSTPQISGIHTDEYGRLYVHVLDGGALTLVRMHADGTVDDAWNLAEIAPDCADCVITLAAGPGGELYAYAEGQPGLARLGPDGLVQHFLNDDPRDPVIVGLRVGPTGLLHIVGDWDGDGMDQIGVHTFHIGP